MSNQQDAFIITPVQVDGGQQQGTLSAQLNSAYQSQQERRQTQNHHQQETQGPLKQIIAQQDSLYKYISWEDPVKTISFYVSVMGILLGTHYLPLTRFALKIAAIGLGVISVAEYSGRMFSPNTFLARLRPKQYKQVPESTLNATLKDVHDLVQYLAVKVQKAVWGQDLGTTFAAFLTCSGLYWLAQILSPFWLIVLGLHSLFVAPLVTSPRGRAVAQDVAAGAGNLANAAAEKGTELARNGQAKAQQLSSQAAGTAKNVAQRGQEVAQSGRDTVVDAAQQAQDATVNAAQRNGLTQSGTETSFDRPGQTRQTVPSLSHHAADNTERPLRSNNPFSADLGVPGVQHTSSNRADLYSDNSVEGGDYTHRGGRGDVYENVGGVGSGIMDRGPPLPHQTFDTPRQMAPLDASARKPVYPSEPVLQYEGNSTSTYQ